jgi:hypothetical protein
MVFVFDLDGTLCVTEGMAYLDAVPDPEAIARVNALYEAGHRICVDSSRGYGAGTDWTERTAEQLREWGVRYHKLRCGVKLPADAYVDAKALRLEELPRG